jgi:hypothetical protein
MVSFITEIMHDIIYKTDYNCRKSLWSWWNNPLIHGHLLSWARGALIRSGGKHKITQV